MYCTNCKKHFAALVPHVDDDGDELYDLTPCCNSECYEESNGQPELPEQPVAQPVYAVPHVFDYEQHKKKKQQFEEKEDMAIAYYLEKYEHDIEMAEEKYFETFK